MKEQLQYLKQNVEMLEKHLQDKKKYNDYEFLALLHANAVIKDFDSDVVMDATNKNRLEMLKKCTQIELMTMIVELQDQCEKQQREIFGMRTTIENLRERQAKHQDALTYNEDIRHRKD